MSNNQNTESFTYVRSALFLVMRYWYLFASSVILFTGIAFFINWYVQPVYEVGTVIAIEGLKKGRENVSEDFMKSFSIYTPVSEIPMEILKMKSTELIKKALLKAHLEVAYYTQDGIKKKEHYTEFPFKVEILKNHIQPLDIKLYIVPQNETRFKLLVEKKEDNIQLFDYEKGRVSSIISSISLNQDFAYGDTIQFDFIGIRLFVDKSKLHSFDSDTKYYFEFNDLNSVTYFYQKALKIEPVGRDIQAASIKLKVKNPQRGIDIITALTEEYLNRNISKKNLIAENTIEYFDSQLKTIEDSLNKAESNLQSFRSTNKVMDINSKSAEVFSEVSDLEKQKAELETRSRYYNYINENIESNQSGTTLLVPSSMGVNDLTLTGMIEEYVRLNNEKNNLLQNKQSQSPYFNTLTNKIIIQKKTLSENVKYLINTNNILLSSIEERLKKQNAQAYALPGTERQLSGMERKHKLNDDIYTYMLEKKAEAQAAKASNLSEQDILEPAKLTQTKPVSPNKLMNLVAALSIGLFLPFIGFGVKALMDNTVKDEQMMKSITKLPTLGRICHKKGRQNAMVLIDSPKSALSETIRTVRTNLDYFLKGKRNQVILVTSTMSGEGKSFVSLNLAISLSLLGRKVILLDFDLRKPNLYKALDVENTVGLSSYLMNNAKAEDCIVSTKITNVDFIAAGPIPPNPAELIGSDKTADLVSALKEKYDYVIIDTPPVGLVTEAFLIMKYADLKIFVVRERVTPKKELVNLLAEIENKNVENIYWLFNDMNIKGTYYGKNNQYYTQG